MTTLLNFLGNIGNLQQRGLLLFLGHKRAHTSHPHDQALLGQFAQRPVHGHAGYAELLHQLQLRRHTRTGRQRAIGNLAQHMVLDLLIERRRQSRHHTGQFTGEGRSAHA